MQVSRPCSRNLKTLAIGCSAAALASVCDPVRAQSDPVDVRGTIKIEVTGSHIYRSDAESALPVQVFTREDIDRTGATTAAELMSKVSANALGLNDQLAITSFGNRGLSSANLRGLGFGSTLLRRRMGGDDHHLCPAGLGA